jgi:glycosyltransferase involved in cell wall biosynthesis
MIDMLSIIIPYYENPHMLRRQVDNWNNYSGNLGKSVEFIIIDDASPNHPAEPILQELRHKKRLYRVEENIPWGQHHARNIGAHEAETEWLFMSDMDIILTSSAAFEIINELNPDPRRYHTFSRKFIGNIREPKYHCNTFLVRKENYWSINGYDCDFCGTYGGDGEFLRQLNIIAPQLHHGDKEKHLKPNTELSGRKVTLWGYEPDIIPDANTKDWNRYGDMKTKYREIFDAKRKAGDMRSKNPIRWDYKRVF